MALNRLLPLVVGARWVVLHQVGVEPFIINDLGLMPTVDLGRDTSGFAIPISNLRCWASSRSSVERWQPIAMAGGKR